jgi:hypothetical protein
MGKGRISWNAWMRPWSSPLVGGHLAAFSPIMYADKRKEKSLASSGKRFGVPERGLTV